MKTIKQFFTNLFTIDCNKQTNNSTNYNNYPNVMGL